MRIFPTQAYMVPTMMEKLVRVVVVVVDSSSVGDDNVTEQPLLLVGLSSGSFRGGGQEDGDVIVPKPVGFMSHVIVNAGRSALLVLKVSLLLLQTSPTANHLMTDAPHHSPWPHTVRRPR